MEVIANPDLESRHVEALSNVSRSELARHAAVHGVTVESLESMAVGVEGDLLVVPLWSDRCLVGLRTIAMDGGEGLVDGSVPGVYRSLYGADKPGAMVAVGAMDTAAMVSVGMSAIGLFSDESTFRIAARELADGHRSEAVVWSMGRFAQYLLKYTPPQLARVTVCVQPREFESVAAWVREGKATRRDVIARVQAFRRMWDRDGGPVTV